MIEDVSYHSIMCAYVDKCLPIWNMQASHKIKPGLVQLYAIVSYVCTTTMLDPSWTFGYMAKWNSLSDVHHGLLFGTVCRTLSGLHAHVATWLRYITCTACKCDLWLIVHTYIRLYIHWLGCLLYWLVSSSYIDLKKTVSLDL